MYWHHLATALALVVLTISPVCLAQESIDSTQAAGEPSEFHGMLLFPEHAPIGSYLSPTLQSLTTEESVQQVSCQQILSSSGSCPKPEYPSVRMTGFFQADAGWFAQDAANIAAVGDIQDGADFRRARLAAVGNVIDNVAYMIEFDFAFPGRPTFMDVWLEIQKLSLLQKLRVGLFRVPFGLDGLTSAKELTFIERGLPFAFLPFRQIGVIAHGTNPNEDFTWALSGFRFPTDLFGAQIGDNGGYGMATRLTGILLGGEQGVLHLGGGYAMVDPANNAVRYLSPPEFFIAETGGAAFVPPNALTFVPPFVDTGPIATETANLFSGELAITFRSFNAQSEVVHAVVNRQGGSTVSFSGVSAQAAYILTGEHRP